MTRIIGTTAASLVLSTALISASGCGYSSKEPGVTIPAEERRENFTDKILPSEEDKIDTHIRNLRFDKKNRTLAAARNLGNKGAMSQKAIPELRTLVAMEPGSDGFPDDEQKAAFKDALDKIIADMQAQGLPIPAEGAAADGENK